MAKTFTKLTRPEMRKLPPGGKINEHGITFEKSATGDGVFTVNIMADGQRIHRVVGRESDGTTRTQAEAFIEKVRSDAKNDRLALPKGRKVALAMRCERLSRNAVFWLRGRGFRHWWCLDRDAFHADA
jgi:hypothetical protein